MTQADPHHCHCFQVLSLSHEIISKMKQDGFKEPIIELPRGHVFGMTKRLSKYLQLHFKVFRDGIVESEMEYAPDYPFAHINPTHSYSAHKETKVVLDRLLIPYRQKGVTPATCIKRKVVKAVKPLHWTEALGSLVLLGVAAGAIYAYSKDKDDS